VETTAAATGEWLCAGGGYAPSVLMSACEAIDSCQLQPALIIGMPIGFMLQLQSGD